MQATKISKTIFYSLFLIKKYNFKWWVNEPLKEAVYSLFALILTKQLGWRFGVLIEGFHVWAPCFIRQLNEWHLKEMGRLVKVAREKSPNRGR